MNLLLGSLLFGFSVLAYASDHLSLNVNIGEPGFIVTLDANPTTGYQWSVIQFDKALLTLSASNYQKPQNTLIGAGGQMHFTFKLNKGKNYPDSTKIFFKYSRSWEPGSGTEKTVTVNFIKAAGN